MGNPNEGEAGVVRELVAGAAAELEEQKKAAAGEQVTLFPVPLTQPRAIAAQEDYERRLGPGRRPGAQNLATREFREFLLARGVSPLVSLMHYATMSPLALAKELGCKPIDAFREWRILQTELAPYLHSRLAFVDDAGQAVPLLQMIVAGQVIAPGGASLTPWGMREALARDHQQIQGVNGGAPAKSHDDKSHGEPK